MNKQLIERIMRMIQALRDSHNVNMLSFNYGMVGGFLAGLATAEAISVDQYAEIGKYMDVANQTRYEELNQ